MEVLESLHGNVVCALAAGIGDYVRCTLLEYSYHDGQFWIFTEGGEKFIGLERNKNVSLAVFEKPPWERQSSSSRCYLRFMDLMNIRKT